MNNSIREILLLYSTIEMQLRAAAGHPLTANDIIANRDLTGEPKWRVIDCIRQLHKKKIIARVNVSGERARYGYIHRDYFPAKQQQQSVPEFLSAKEAELFTQPTQLEDTARLKVNKDKSVTVTIGQVRITIEVEENKND